MDVIITAGGIPQPDEPLYEFTHGGNKSLLEIHGKSIVQWVLDALSDCSEVGQIILVGMEDEGNLKCTHPLHYCANHHDLLTNILNGIGYLKKIHPAAKKVLLVSGDLPAITSSMLDWMIAQVKAEEADFYYTVVEDRTMEKTFPGSNRTYLPLKDLKICGGDVLAVRVSESMMKNPIWNKLIETRKKPLSQAALFGLDTLFLIAFRLISLAQIEKRLSAKLGIKGKVLVTPFAEMGMDVDKPHQLEIMRKFLENRVSP